MAYIGVPKEYDNEADKSYAAGVFDETGHIKVTEGDAVLRLSVGATQEQIGYLRVLHGPRYRGSTILTGVVAHDFLEYIQGHVVCTKVQVDYALSQWDAIHAANKRYRKMRRCSAKGMPGAVC